MTKKILITGGAGFVGSSLALSLKSKYPAYEIICFDNLKRRGSELNLRRLADLEVKFVHGDIRNKEDFSAMADVTTIIEASAEPSVLAGLNGSPDYLINTNLMGTVNCLGAALRLKADFIFLSTSRVYPIETIDRINHFEEESRFSISNEQTIPGISAKGISEKFPLEGFRSLYGATKLASEYLIQEYNQFYGLKTVINRCGVLAGPWQMGKVDQGVIGLWVARHYWKKKLGYIGYGGQGKQVRDVLDINDLFSLVDFQVHHMDQVNGQILNAGGGIDSSVSLKELTAICQTVTGNKIEIEAVKENRKADIRIYVTDNSLISEITKWEPRGKVEDLVKNVFQWISENESSLKPIFEI